jgi:hypothetical protein
MITAVNALNPRFEGLENYILGGKRGAPTDVPRQLAPSARLANSRPTDQPQAPARIPTSSQRPWQPTNQRIPYARYFFKSGLEFDHESQFKPLDAGDVVFVHKTSQAMGHGANRMIKVTSIPMLNKMLANHRDGHTSFTNQLNPDKNIVARINSERRQAGQQDYDFNYTKFIPSFDWRALTLLADFTPDGIAINADHDADESLINVCIAGPTPCRNTKNAVASMDEGRPVQEIDASCVILDMVFVGLFYTHEKSTYTFHYRLFTGRQYRTHYGTWKSVQTETIDPGAAASGPTGKNFKHLCTAWRIGKIMDTRLVDGLGANTHQILVNVAIEEWPASRLRTYYDVDAERNNGEAYVELVEYIAKKFRDGEKTGIKFAENFQKREKTKFEEFVILDKLFVKDKLERDDDLTAKLKTLLASERAENDTVQALISELRRSYKRPK